MADETIETLFIVNADKAISDTQKFRQQVDATKAQLRSLAAESKKSFADVAKGMESAFKTQRLGQLDQLKTVLSPPQYQKAFAQASSDIRNYSSSVKTALSEVRAETKSTSSSFGNLGAAASKAAVGLAALSILRNVAQWLREAAKAGLEFVKSTYALEVGIRALQRAGVDISIKEAYEQIERLKNKYGGLATDAEWRAGTAAFYNLNRDLGFTAEQFNILQDKITGLAIINNRSMDEVQKTVALALSSGYTEGLQRLGVSINRVTIAMEAQRLGFEGGYMALTEQQRALATYNLILEKTAVYEEDLAAYQETTPGRIEAATKRWENLKNVIGTGLLPVWQALVEWGVKLAETIFTIIMGVGDMANAFRESAGPLWNFLETLGRFIPALGGTAMVNAFADFAANVRGFREDILGDTEVNPQAAEDKITQNISDALMDRLAEIEALEEEIAERRRQIALDLARDLAEIEENLGQKLEDLARDHARKMSEIVQDAQQQIADEQARYQLDVEQAWDDYYASLEEAQQDYHDKELEAEEDFQEKLLRLREDLLMGLEDALRSRDARQVLRLIRQYKLDKERLERERAEQQRDNARDYQRQMQDLERQREQRLRKLRQELEFRIRMIKIQMMRELQAERERYAREQEEVRLAAERQKEDRLQKYEEQMTDLEDYQERKLKAIAEALFEELKITGEGMARIREALLATLGPGGYAEQIYAYYVQMAQSYMAEAMAFGPSMPQSITNPDKPGKDTGGGGGGASTGDGEVFMATGGMLLANRPTKVTFGEASPEAAFFMPLDKIAGGLNSLGRIVKNGEGKSGENDYVKVDIGLGPDLTGRIVDSSVGAVAEIFNEMMRARQQ